MVALVAEEGKKNVCPKNGISRCRLKVERVRAGVVWRSAVALSGSESRPRRAERCGELRSPGMMNGKSLVEKTQARGLAHHPDVRAGSLGLLVQYLSFAVS